MYPRRDDIMDNRLIKKSIPFLLSSIITFLITYYSTYFTNIAKYLLVICYLCIVFFAFTYNMCLFKQKRNRFIIIINTLGMTVIAVYLINLIIEGVQLFSE